MAFEQADPFSWARSYMNAMSNASAQDSSHAQNALMQVFQTEAGRQQPWAELPVALAKQNNQYDLAMRNNTARSAETYMRRYGPDGPMFLGPDGKPDKSRANLATNIAKSLAKDLNISLEAAAGIAGNLAAETGDFKHMQELAPVVPGSRGGYGWAQWTGPRRKQFEQWAAQNKLNPSSPQANYGFLIHELTQTEEGRRLLPKLQQARTAEEAAVIVSNVYLRPGIPNMDGRTSRARRIHQQLQVSSSNDMVREKLNPKGKRDAELLRSIFGDDIMIPDDEEEEEDDDDA